jgi:hypothetical protein
LDRSGNKIGKLRHLEGRLREISAHCAEGAGINCGVIEALWVADAIDLEMAPRGSVCCAGSVYRQQADRPADSPNASRGSHE